MSSQTKETTMHRKNLTDPLVWIALAQVFAILAIGLSCAPNHHTAWPTAPDTTFVPAPADSGDCDHGHHGHDRH